MNQAHFIGQLLVLCLSARRLPSGALVGGGVPGGTWMDLDQAGHITHLLLTPFMTCNFWSYFQPLTCYKGSPQQVDLHAWFGWFPFLMVPQRGIVSLAGAEPGTVHLPNEGANYYTTERLVCVWVILYFLHMFYTYMSLWLMDKCFAWAFPVSMIRIKGSGLVK